MSLIETDLRKSFIETSLKGGRPVREAKQQRHRAPEAAPRLQFARANQETRENDLDAARGNIRQPRRGRNLLRLQQTRLSSHNLGTQCRSAVPIWAVEGGLGAHGQG